MGFTHRIMYRIAVLIASVAALPVEVQNNFGPGPSGVPYGPRPGPSYAPLPQGDSFPDRSYKAKPILVEEEEEFLPQPYKYEYGVQDDYTKAAFAKSESQNEVGAVTGSYKVNLPDGRIQTVTYTADPVHGYKAVVSYEGEPVYPPEPEEGYGNAYKKQLRQQVGPPRVYRESPLPNPEYVNVDRVDEQQYLPEYVARVQ